MKNIRSVFILLIGMISLTAFATTSKLDQKPTTDFRIEPSIQIEVVNVANDFQVVSVYTGVTILNNCEVEVFKIAINPVAVLKDVGWQKEKKTCQSKAYQDKFLDNYKNQFKPIANMRCNS